MDAAHGSMTLRTLDETAMLGRALAEVLARGDLVLLRGEVGAGKTTLVRAVARGLGIADPIVSPTYLLAQRYQGRHPLPHIDAYRLSGADDEELGLLLDDAPDAVTMVEWPDALSAGLPPAQMAITIEILDSRERLLRFTSRPSRLTDLERHLGDLRDRYVHAATERGGDT